MEIDWPGRRDCSQCLSSNQMAMTFVVTTFVIIFFFFPRFFTACFDFLNWWTIQDLGKSILIEKQDLSLKCSAWKGF